MRKVLYPGSFDPVTTGHEDIIVRACALFDEVIVGVLYNPHKASGAFSIEERLALLRAVTAPFPNIRVKAFGGLLVDAVRACGADAVIRGLRTMADADVEVQMARLNRQMGQVETLLIPATPAVSHVSATMAREIGRFGGNLTGLVPESIRRQVAETLAKQQ